MKRKSIIGAVALALVVVLGIAYVGFSLARNSWNPAKWVSEATQNKPDDQTPDNQDKPTTVDDNDVFTIDNGVSSGISLYSGRIATADYEAYGITDALSAVTISAVITPESASDKTVKWTIENVDGSDCSDEVTITPSSNGNTTVTCLKPFSKEKVIKCVSNSNPSIYGTAKANYLQKLDYTTVACDNLTLNGDNSSTINWYWQNISNYEINGDVGKPITFNNVFATTAYSKIDTVTSNSISVKVSDELKSLIAAHSWLTSDISQKGYEKELLYSSTFSQLMMFYDDGHDKPGNFDCVSNAYDEGVDMINKTDLETLYSLFNQCDVDLIITVNTQLQKGGTVTKSYNVNLIIPVNNITIEGGDVDF